jgi:uncharacterized protein
MIFRRPVLAILCLAAISASAQMLLTLTINEHRLSVEIADTDQARQIGLMNRDKLPEEQGMVFVYEKAHRLTFWMKNTRIPLDIAFLAADGAILQIETMQPFDETHTISEQPALYALEVNQGWFARHRVKVGERVKGLPKTGR